MEFTFNENELDNALYNELCSSDLDVDKINTLLQKGANVNAVDKWQESLLLQVISVMQDDENLLDKVKFLVANGADVNYTVEGFNSLFSACIAKKYSVVEFLLKSGANPNCVSTEDESSLLQSIELDLWVEEELGGDTMIISKIIELLIQYGGKHEVE